MRKRRRRYREVVNNDISIPSWLSCSKRASLKVCTIALKYYIFIYNVLQYIYIFNEYTLVSKRRIIFYMLYDLKYYRTTVIVIIHFYML